ncbi:S-Ena type endospore appendage [Paenibacillus sp. CF384]|uniref:S-Ena type endospore appendage n=1 Tax=Paenibacillus sp. CF384 TaxID=1884382 RepID=UPI000895279B|nr:S-Ena type endospore appendage [Paenibacillus sp. CF384]SDW61591.1 hypothetical protein SAMN05518855_1003324 [Paenibacillus sp. CF384]
MKCGHKHRRMCRSHPTPLCPPTTNNIILPQPPYIHPPDPPKKHKASYTFDKECCGSILLQGEQSEFQLWELDVLSTQTLTQISIFINDKSTQALEIDVVGITTKHMIVPPGSTVNYIGQSVTAVRVPSQGSDSTYIEGKYVISTTLTMQS